MSDLWAYYPPVCDGDYCPMDCDHCPKQDAALEADPGRSIGDYPAPLASLLEGGVTK